MQLPRVSSYLKGSTAQLVDKSAIRGTLTDFIAASPADPRGWKLAGPERIFNDTYWLQPLAKLCHCTPTHSTCWGSLVSGIGRWCLAWHVCA